jgi:hypothetical protein
VESIKIFGLWLFFRLNILNVEQFGQVDLFLRQTLCNPDQRRPI